MSNGMVVAGANPAGLFQAGATLSQRALAVMQSRQGPSELGQGITGGFGVIGYRGKVWRIKYGGDEQALTQKDPRTGVEAPLSYIECVIIAATPHLTKTWYEQSYTEGSNAAPDCASSDGVKPDVASPKKQSDLCATCRHNQFGSRISADGRGRGKACQDTKRLAVVPYPDLDNEGNGGPMLLRIPPASLSNLQKFAGLMERNGYPFYGVSVYLYFEGDEAYPQINFKPARPLSDDEFSKVEHYRNDERVARVLNSTEVQLQVAAQPQPEQPLFGGPPGGQPSPAPQPAPQQTFTPGPMPQPMQPAPAPQPAPQPASVPMQQAAPPVREFTPAPQPAPQQAAPPPQAAPQAPPAPQAIPAPAPASMAASNDPGAPQGQAPQATQDIDSFLDALGGM